MIALVGEAWGEHEEAAQRPFVGPAGRLLDHLLTAADIRRSECFITNVFNLRPQPTNDVKNLCGPKADGIPGFPALQAGKYVLAQYAPHLERLYAELSDVNPYVTVAFGATASWALCRTSGIRAIRGAPLLGQGGRKVLPTYHPAAALRDYSLCPIIIADLLKARREAGFSEIRRPQREIWTAPTLGDLDLFEAQHLQGARRIACDIETKGDQITCIGFAPSPQVALVVPFFQQGAADHSYWPNAIAEAAAWAWVRRVLMDPAYQFVFQNGLYDMHFLWRRYGIPVPGAAEDTMLLHHALQPEMEKGLGFLGTLYTDEAAWKFLRHIDTIKRED